MCIRDRFIIIQLHDLIMSNENVKSCIKWAIPVYENPKCFCYIHPLIDKTKVELCFMHGHMLKDTGNLLEVTKRKMVKGIIINDLTDNLLSDLDVLIKEAISLNP